MHKIFGNPNREGNLAIDVVSGYLKTIQPNHEKTVLINIVIETMNAKSTVDHESLEFGTGTPSFSCMNAINLSPANCLEIGTGQPSFSSLLRITEQPSYSITCLATSTFVSSQCLIEGSMTFPFNSETSFDIARRESRKLLCEQDREHPRKRPCDPEDSGWQSISKQRDYNIGNQSPQTLEEKRKIRKRSWIKESGMTDCIEERCVRSDPDMEKLEKYSLGSGNPSISSSLN